MNWLSKEDERKSWKMFRKSFWYPAYMWFICIFIMYGISYIIVTFPKENRNSHRLILMPGANQRIQLLYFIGLRDERIVPLLSL